MQVATPTPRHEFTRPLLGTDVRIVICSPTAERARHGADAAFARIEALSQVFSEYDGQSELSQLNATAARHGGSAQVSATLLSVLTEATALAAASGGAFDPTVGPYVRLWRRSLRQQQLPTTAQLQAARQRVGYRLLQFGADSTVTFLRPGMELSLGGIAKGYIAGEALRVLLERGLGSSLVDAGGDLAIGTPPPNAKGWRIAIAPQVGDPEIVGTRRVRWLHSCGVATSGDAARFVVIDDVRYGHVLETRPDAPGVGLGCTRRRTATVIAPTAALADGLASALVVLERKPGFALLQAFPQTNAQIVEQHEDGWDVWRTAGLALP
ncbi:MAG: FAD:protein FMN transferase [Planctomycetota bacterium]